MEIDFHSEDKKSDPEIEGDVAHRIRLVHDLHNLSAGVVSLCYLWEAGVLSCNLAAQLLPTHTPIFKLPSLPPSEKLLLNLRNSILDSSDDDLEQSVLTPALVKSYLQMVVRIRPSLRPVLGHFMRRVQNIDDADQRQIWNGIRRSMCVESLLGCLVAERTIDAQTRDALEFAKAEELLGTWDSLSVARKSKNKRSDDDEQKKVCEAALIFAAELPVSRSIIPILRTSFYSGVVETDITPSVHNRDQSSLTPATFVFSKNPFIVAASGIVSDCQSYS